MQRSTSASSDIVSGFYLQLLQHQLRVNEKIGTFASESKSASEAELATLRARAEQQKAALGKYEEEQRMNQLREMCIDEITRLSEASPSVELKHLVTISFASANNAPHTEQIASFCTTYVSDNRPLYLSDLKRIAAIMSECEMSGAHVDTLRQLCHQFTALVDSLNKLVAKALACNDIDECLQLRSTIEKAVDDRTLERISDAVPVVNSALAQLDALDTKHADLVEQAALLASGGGKPSLKLGDYQSSISYVNKALQSIKWLSNELKEDVKEKLTEKGNFIAHALTYDNILAASGSSSLSAPNGEQKQADEPTASAVLNTVHIITGQLTSDSINSSDGAAGNARAGIFAVFVQFASTIVNEVRKRTSESEILMYSVIISGVYRTLSPNNAKIFIKILHATMYKNSMACMPKLYLGRSSETAGSGDKKNKPAGGGGGTGPTELSNFEEQLRVFILFASLAEVTDTAVQDCWLWAVRVGSQMSNLLEVVEVAKSAAQAASDGGADEARLLQKSLENSTRAVTSFIRIAGSALYSKYQSKFKELLLTFEKLVSGHVLMKSSEYGSKLLAVVQSAVQKGYISPVYFKDQSPFILSAVALGRSLLQSRQNAERIDADRTGPVMQTIKDLGINRIGAIFNRLSVTKESQDACLASLLEKIVQASSAQNSSVILEYTLFKVSARLLAECQQDSFIPTVEGHPGKLARLASSICVKLQGIDSLIKAQFFNQCPLCLPKHAETGLAGDDFFRDMAFLPGSKGQRWEGKSEWLDRMTKILCTYAVISIQPEQAPVSMEDIWAWLARFTNYCANTASPSFYTSTAFEVVLKIVSSSLFKKYGPTFMGLLSILRIQVLPKLSERGEDADAKKRLAEFLNRFIDSNGRDVCGMFIS